MAKEVEENQVLKGVRATFIPSHDVVRFSVFIIEEAFSTKRTYSLLSSSQFPWFGR